MPRKSLKKFTLSRLDVARIQRKRRRGSNPGRQHGQTAASLWRSQRCAPGRKRGKGAESAAPDAPASAGFTAPRPRAALRLRRCGQARAGARRPAVRSAAAAAGAAVQARLRHMARHPLPARARLPADPGQPVPAADLPSRLPLHAARDDQPDPRGRPGADPVCREPLRLWPQPVRAPPARQHGLRGLPAALPAERSTGA